MFSQIFNQMEGFGTWSIITMILFFLVFIAVVIYTLKLDKNHVQYLSEIPLNDNTIRN
jgi:hypothetical protein